MLKYSYARQAVPACAIVSGLSQVRPSGSTGGNSHLSGTVSCNKTRSWEVIGPHGEGTAMVLLDGCDVSV